MKYLILLLIPLPVFAGTGLGDFFGFFTGWAEDIYLTVTNDVPSMLERLAAYVIYLVAYIKVELMINSITFAWGIAKVMLDDVGFASLLQSLINQLPGDLRSVLTLINFDKAVEWIMTAHVTRFVLNLF